MKQLTIVLLFTFLTTLSDALPAIATSSGERTGTLRKIADSGTIVLGYHESTIPFTYITSDGKVMGYSYDIALKIADAVKRELKLPKLQIKQVPFTTQTRFPIIQNGTVDITCGATTNTTERQKIVAFSNTIFIAGSRLMARKNSGIRDFPDLAGKNVVTFAASTSEKMLRKMNSEKNSRINIISTFDRGTRPLAVLQAEQADAFMMDDILLYATIRDAWRPDEWIVTGTPQSYEAYGCVMRRDDPVFKKVVDQEIARIMKSGEAETLYRKWLMSPIPPKGVNLGFPMSEAMTRLFKNPNDKPFE
ncbi:MAG: transporter substrate-binding domain-containing protein [Desulfuromonadaceae bacterium]|nr:transporter substrate-binding domain-containing protein [Desulfuromonadaceae bacterium]